jgi:hypothetical protein
MVRGRLPTLVDRLDVLALDRPLPNRLVDLVAERASLCLSLIGQSSLSLIGQST